MVRFTTGYPPPANSMWAAETPNALAQLITGSLVLIPSTAHEIQFADDQLRSLLRTRSPDAAIVRWHCQGDLLQRRYILQV
jgi:hypothetical protein